MAQRDEVNSWFYIKLASELDCYLSLLYGSRSIIILSAGLEIRLHWSFSL